LRLMTSIYDSRRQDRTGRRDKGRSVVSRREAIGTLGAAYAATLLDPHAILHDTFEQHCPDTQWGALLGTLPLSRDDGAEQPFGVKMGRGLDARLVTDLSALEPDRLITSNRLAFVRTEAPGAADWTIAISGEAGDSRRVSVADLARLSRSMGSHLLECSGNNNAANFGLMSVSEYDGVPLADVVRDGRRPEAPWGVLVSGLDPTVPSSSSVPGASWILPLSSVQQLGAFLAVRMNGEALPADHGAPVRLVVPGWYGCTWIKWVNEIRLTSRDEPATGQMKEFAARTHQKGVPELARDYEPPEIEATAMPIRVEKRRGTTGLEYRVVGIVWGGRKPVDRLAIRFGADAPWTTFSPCPAPTTHRIWSVWEYRWKPPAAGTYRMALRVPDASVPQRRLDSGFYIRQVRVDEI